MTFTVPSNEELVLVRTKAERYRRERAVYKDGLRNGTISVSQFFDDVEKGDPVVSNIRIRPFLLCLPGIGYVRADNIIRSLGVAPIKRMGGLGRKQRASLREFLEDRETARTARAQRRR